MKGPHQHIGPRWFSWRFVLVLVAGAGVLGFNFASRLLLTNDDTRFPVLARNVLLNGHWLVPALPDGTPHIMKPPLVVWLIALASWPAQAVSVRTAVLPFLLAPIGVVLLTYWLGRWLFDPHTGVVAGLTVATTLGLYQMAHSSIPDMVQLVAGTGAIAVAPAPVFAINLEDLALSFNLDRPVLSAKTVRTFEDRVRAGERAYLVISERAVGHQGVDGCLRPVARGRVTRRHFVMLEPVDCDKTGSPAGIPLSG